MIINNIELQDFDLMDADMAENYEKAYNKMEQKDEKYKKEIENKQISLGDIIRKECTIIFDFFNDLFGEGTDKKIFGNKTNYRECTQALKQVIDYTLEQKKELDEIYAKYSPDRLKR